MSMRGQQAVSGPPPAKPDPGPPPPQPVPAGRIKIKVSSMRGSVITDEEYEAVAVPRIGDLVRTQYLAAARVTDVTWDLVSGRVTVLVR